MTTSNCSRCGRRGEVEYGPDGLAYCSSCAFFGLNKQCWRCRMYLPAAELQQYKGQWACPYCIQDMRDADRSASEGSAPQRPRADLYILPEQCERCGRDLDHRVYIWNGRKLCKSCMDEEQQKWTLVGGGPMASPYKVTIKPERRRKDESLLDGIMGAFLQLLGIRKKRKEIIIVEAKMPISRAKPMAEKAMKPKARETQAPQSEGIMGASRMPSEDKKTSAKKRKAVPKKKKQ
ncbi:MAG: hypothetical protein AB1295_03755 [Candidatus Micrarchaeota archaeon]